jgi:hypothetical protein
LQLLESELAARAAGSTEQITENMVMAKRDIFGELVEGVAAMKSCHREQKLTLRSYKVDAEPRCRRQIPSSRETEPSGSSSGSPRAKIPGYALAAGRSGRWLADA